MSTIHRPTERVIDILSIVSESQEGMSFTEIGSMTNIPKGTLSPILQTLVDKNILFLQLSTMKYIIGIKSFKIGYSFIEGIDIIQSYMQGIVDQCDEICQLGTLDGKNVLYIEKIEPVQAIRLESNVGKTLPAYVTALGKCLLSGYDDNYILGLYKDGIEKFAKNSIDNVGKLIEEIHKVRKNNICYEWGESNDEVMCLAVPIYYRNKPILSLSVSVPIYRAEKTKIELIESVLVNQRIKIEKEIRNLDMPDMFL